MAKTKRLSQDDSRGAAKKRGVIDLAMLLEARAIV